MSIKFFFETPAENRAYIDGYTSGKKADMHDWVRAEIRVLDERKAKEKAWTEMQQIADAAKTRIQELEDQLIHERREHERREDELMSQIRAYQVAFRQQEREMEQGVEITDRASRKRRRL